MKFGVLVFPGSGGDADCHYVIKEGLKADCDFIWHKETTLTGYDAIIIPGGSSFGDYLRCGAIARFSPIMQAVKEFAEKGGPVLGIGNGFQILLEAGLLPGALLKNRSLRFICRPAHFKVKNNNTVFTSLYQADEVIMLPIAHGEGNYFCDDDIYKSLQDNGQILLTYCDAQGQETEEANLSGSKGNIAGIMNKNGNVMGMMPHPERAAEKLLGSETGLKMFSGIMQAVKEGKN